MGNLVKQNHCQLQVEEGRGLGDGDCAEVFNKLEFCQKESLSAVGRGREGLGNGDCAEAFIIIRLCKRGCRICTQSSSRR